MTIPTRCPYCNCPFDHYTLAAQRKHMAKCGSKRSRVTYTGNPRGRPRVHNRIGDRD